MKNLYKIQNELYIIDNNEKVTQDGIWAKCSFTGSILKNRNGQYAYKVILTTNDLLIKDGVQSIDDEFLKWFVKNPSCEEVEIGEGTRYEDEWIDNEDGGEIYQHQYCCYKIIIPKEEPKQEIVTKTDNVLIAEFMGLTIITDGISLFDSDYKALKKYNESWDCLMPVVEKIIRTPSPVKNPADTTKSTKQHEIQAYVGYVNIKKTHECVVEFIKWYNKQKA
jgi:hypothetical protein